MRLQYFACFPVVRAFVNFLMCLQKRYKIQQEVESSKYSYPIYIYIKSNRSFYFLIFLLCCLIDLPQWTGSKASIKKLSPEWDCFHLQSYPLVSKIYQEASILIMSFYVIDQFAVFLCWIRAKTELRMTVFKHWLVCICSEMPWTHSGWLFVCAINLWNQDLFSSTQICALNLISTLLYSDSLVKLLIEVPVWGGSKGFFYKGVGILTWNWTL